MARSWPWADLASLGISDQGSYQLKVTTVYIESGITYLAPSAVVGISVNNSSPTGTLLLSTVSAPQGQAVAVRVVDYFDPAVADTLATASVAYDFDNDGTIDLAGQPVGASVEIPASFRVTPGLKTVRAVLTDKDGGSRELFASYLVTAVQPTITVATISPINEGSDATLSASINNPGGLTVTGWLVNWGDGSTDEFLTTDLHLLRTHRYADDGGYTLTITALTSSGEVSATALAQVNDVAPTVTVSGAASTIQGSATAYTVTLSVVDPGTDTVSQMAIDWGDNTTTILPGGVTTASHTYATIPRGGIATVRVRSIINEDGVFFNPSISLPVTVVNAVPQIPNDFFNVPADGTEATTVNLSALAASVATGSEPLNFKWTLTAPNGTVFTLAEGVGNVILADPASFSGTQYLSVGGASFTPTDNGTYIVTLTVTDPDGGVATLGRSVQVANVAPTITSLTVPATGTAGQPVIFSATASDPGGVNDPLKFTWTVTDLLSGSIVATMTGASVSFTPLGGTYGVELSVTDGDGGSDSQSSRLDVSTPAPIIPNGGFNVPSTGVEGGLANFTVTVMSPTNPAPTVLWLVTRVGDPLNGVVRLDGNSVQ